MAVNHAIGTIFKAEDRATPTIGRLGSKIRGLYAESKLLNKGIGRLGNNAGFRQMGRGVGQLRRSFGGLNQRIKTVGASLVALGSIGTVAVGWKMTTDFAAQADELSKFTRQIGMTAEAYQEWQYVADRQGVSNEEFKKGVTGFSKRLGELRLETGSLYTVLDKSNPALMKQLQTTTSTEEALSLYMAALEQMKDPADKAALASAAFGGKLAKFTRIAEAGEDGIKALRLEAKSFGLISSESALQSEGFIDSLTNWKMAVGGLRNEIGANLLPTIKPYLDQMTNWVKLNRELIGQRVGEYIKNIAKWLESIKWQEIGQGIKSFTQGIGWFVDKIGGTRNALIGLAVVMNGSLVGGVLNLTAGFLRLGLAASSGAVGGIWKYRKSIGGAFVKTSKFAGKSILNIGRAGMWATKGVFKLSVATGKFLATSLLTGAKGAGKFAFTVGKTLVKAAARGARSVLMLGRAFMMNPIGLAVAGIAAGAYLIIKNWSNVKDWFSNMWGSVKNIFGGFGGFLKGVFTGDMEVAVGGIKQMWGGITDYYSGLWDGVKGIFSAVWNDLIGIILPDKWIAKGNEIGSGVVDAIETKWLELKEMLGNVAGIFDFSAWWDVGVKAGEALGKGISAVWQNIKNWFREKIYEMFDILPNWVKDKLGFDKKDGKPKGGDPDPDDSFNMGNYKNPYDIGNRKPYQPALIMDNQKLKPHGDNLTSTEIKSAMQSGLKDSKVEGKFEGGLDVMVHVKGQPATVTTNGHGKINEDPIKIDTTNRHGGVGSFNPGSL